MALPIDPQEWRETKPQEPIITNKIKPGVYVMVIRGVFDKGTYLEFKLDFAEGEKNAGFIQKMTNGNLFAWWSCMIKRSYYGKGNNSRFKGDITAIEKSNPGYSFEKTGFEENTLIGKIVVGILYEDEYMHNGEIKCSLKLDSFRSIEAFRNGEVQPREKDTVAMKAERENRKNEQQKQGLKGVYEPNMPQFNPNLNYFGNNSYPNATPTYEDDTDDLPW